MPEVTGQNSVLTELSIKFDIYYNNISSNQAPGLTEAEKSIFLTKSQEDVITSLYNGTASGESFEETEELRRYLSNLVTEVSLEPMKNSYGNLIGMSGNNSYFFTLPYGNDDNTPAVWFITYESALINDTSNSRCAGQREIEVVPIRQDEYHKLKHNPFRGLNDRRAFRLDLSDNVVEIVSKNPVNKYYVRYIRRPYPIILEDLTDGININGYTEAREPLEVSKFLHQRIIESAVTSALKYSGYGNNG